MALLLPGLGGLKDVFVAVQYGGLLLSGQAS